jgi:hypothetical protein
MIAFVKDDSLREGWMDEFLWNLDDWDGFLWNGWMDEFPDGNE